MEILNIPARERNIQIEASILEPRIKDAVKRIGLEILMLCFFFMRLRMRKPCPMQAKLYKEENNIVQKFVNISVLCPQL